MNQEPQYEDWNLGDLKPHPLQNQYFTGLDEHGIAELAADIERNDLKEPIEVMPEGNAAGLPKGTIVAGHQRRLALIKVGCEECVVQVRYDLADASAEEIEQYLLDSNQNRQHLSKLKQARIARRNYEIEQNRKPGSLRGWEAEEARDRVGKQINMSGRNLQRYCNVLNSPLEVQQAFDANELPLVMASRVASLSQQEQDEIAKRIADGEKPKAVVEEYLPQQEKGTQVSTLLRRFFKVLGKTLTEVGPRLDEVQSAPSEGIEELLEDAAEFFQKLKEQYLRNQERADQAMAELLEELE